MKKHDCYIYSMEDIGDYLSIPRLLVTHKVYRTLSSEAKIIYSLFLERMRENGLQDEQNRNYIIYPEYELQAVVNISDGKLTQALHKLEVVGLIQRKKQAFDKPTLIYLHNCLRIEEKTEENKVKTPPTLKEYHAKVRKDEQRRKQGNIIRFSGLGV